MGAEKIQFSSRLSDRSIEEHALCNTTEATVWLLPDLSVPGWPLMPILDVKFAVIALQLRSNYVEW